MALVMLLLVLVPVGSAAPAQAAPWCDDELPRPASPLTGGGFNTVPEDITDADPFADPTVPIQNVYGWHYDMVTYDTGCTPGASLMPRTGTEIANMLMEPVGMMGSLGHALMSAVISPTWLEPIDAGVAEGVAQVRAGTWFPYVGLAVLAVAVGMLWSTRAGRLDSSATAGVWAVVVLGLATYLGSYPMHATQMVDGAVQEAAVGISTAISTDPELVGPPMPGAGQEAIDRQWGSILRTTTYRTWSEGMFGSATSSTARTYGPALFKATHLTWTEAQALESDPSGAGQAILDAKAEEFESTAEAIESADPYAYSHLQGKHWGSRLSAAVGGLVAGVLVMLFLVVAPIGMFVGYIVIRVAVMFSPAAGLIFMVEKLRNVALGLVSKVGRFVVMGPLWLLGALVVLRLNSAVLNAQVPLWLQLLICTAISFVAWQLLKPVSGIPGMRGLGRVLRTALATATGVHLGNRASRRGSGTGQGQDDDTGSRPVDWGEMPVQERDQVVYTEPERPGVGFTDAPRRGLPRGQVHEEGQRVDGGTLHVVKTERGAAEQDRPRPSLMGGPVAMSSRRARHLSSSNAAVVGLPAGAEATASPEESSAAAAEGESTQSSVVEGQVQDGEQSAVYDSGEERPGTYRAVTVAPIALPAGRRPDGSESSTEESADEASSSGVVAAGSRGTFAPRGSGEDLPAEDDGPRPAAAGGGVVMVPTSAASQEERGAVLSAAPSGAVQAQEQASPVEVQQLPQQDADTAPPAFLAEPHTGDVPSSQKQPAAEGSGTFEPDESRLRSRGDVPVEGSPRWIDDGVIVEDDLPSEVHEANRTIGSDGKPVFQVYRPQGMSVVRRVD